MTSDAPLARSLPTLAVGTLGHFGHGKTTLVAAITAALAARGTTARALRVVDIAKGSIPRPAGETTTAQVNPVGYTSAERAYAHLDCPGARRLTRAASIGAAQIDVALVVVAADESVRAQTREHLAIARAAGVGSLVGFLNKCDAIDDPALVDLAELEMRDAFGEFGYAANETPVVRGAAGPALAGDGAWARSIDALIDALDRDVTSPARDEGSSPWLAIHRVLHRPTKGVGVVVTGRLRRGTLTRGARLLAVGPGAPEGELEVVELQRFGRTIERGEAGEYLGLRLHTSPATPDPLRGLRRGDALLGEARPVVERFLCDLDVLSLAQGGRHTPFRSGHSVDLAFATTSSAASLVLPDGLEAAQPGSKLRGVFFHLARPHHVEPGLGLWVRDGCDGLQRVYGGGPQWSGTMATGVITRIIG